MTPITANIAHVASSPKLFRTWRPMSGARANPIAGALPIVPPDEVDDAANDPHTGNASHDSEKRRCGDPHPAEGVP